MIHRHRGQDPGAARADRVMAGQAAHGPGLHGRA